MTDAPRPLWDKGGSSDADMMRYTARDDWQLDRRLLPYDLVATRAHVEGLARIGVLSEVELGALCEAIDGLRERARTGDFTVTEAHEDCHSAIEAELTALVGDAGKKVHTGRSRNDQVLVALRLYERDACDAIDRATREAARALLDVAEREALTPLPGYTHLQRAVPSSVGLWLAGIAESLLDGLALLDGARRQIDRCPLGTAAGYGVNLPLDRQGVSDALGFAALCVNPLAAQASRGTVEVGLLAACWQLMAHARRLAWDLSLFTTSEFGFVALDESLTTGSSIMPQKRNPDVVELVRAACAVVQGALSELMGLLSLPSGYQRDLQLCKAPLFRGLDETLATLRIVHKIVNTMTFDRERMRAALSPDCFATDRAVELSLAGVPFREAYQQVAAEIATLEQGDAERSLRARVSPGACADLRLDELRARLGEPK